MDPLEVDIFQKILSSCNGVWSEINTKDEWKNFRTENRFPTIDNNLLNALITSLVNLLNYKVSHALEQRYEVRLCLIDIIRAWSRLGGSLSKTFLNGENGITFMVIILEKYLTDEFLTSVNSVEHLINFHRALIYLLPKNPSLMKLSHKIILRLAELELTEESEKLLVSILEAKENIQVDDTILEQIYSSQRIKFIEIPLKNTFVGNYSKLSNSDDHDCQLNLDNDLDELYDRIVSSSLIFHLTVSLLYDLFLVNNYSQEILIFIKIILESVSNRCKARGKDILDLYPINLQSCVILLRIEPSQHSNDSKNYTLNELKNIFLTNNQDAVILVSHFPLWLEVFASFLISNQCDLNS
ncbi:uncharacterized protein LOC122508261 [Leptopilina heterotoma]|uniref:uncharacterized protein LOC122508261 n=1 Tax=Leptopilina heterotoma TaxID=63436 RepID=UPI001CA98B28|nr:uncharacterized protein LOC122508261 [Leptopilina heterotoma]